MDEWALVTTSCVVISSRVGVSGAPETSTCIKGDCLQLKTIVLY
jgi:hypothetical protein